MKTSCHNSARIWNESDETSSYSFFNGYPNNFTTLSIIFPRIKEKMTIWKNIFTWMWGMCVFGNVNYI